MIRKQQALGGPLLWWASFLEWIPKLQLQTATDEALTGHPHAEGVVAAAHSLWAIRGRVRLFVCKNHSIVTACLHLAPGCSLCVEAPGRPFTTLRWYTLVKGVPLDQVYWCMVPACANDCSFCGSQCPSHSFDSRVPAGIPNALNFGNDKGPC